MGSKFVIYCILSVTFISCKHNYSNEKKKIVDAVFTTHSVAAIEKGDTLEFVWRETSNEKCLPIKVHANKKNRTKRINAYSDKIFNRKPNSLNILGYKFVLDKEKSTNKAIVYKIEYTTYVDQELIGSFNGKYKVTRLDLRDRKLFYNTMNYYESIFGKADKYSISKYGSETDRNLAHFVFWKCAHYHISIKNEILGKCVPDDKKRQILYIEVSRVLWIITTIRYLIVYIVSSLVVSIDFLPLLR